MANFESGVRGYIKTAATVTVGFPIDWKGNEHIACIYCPFLSSNNRLCQLNKSVVEFPERYVGSECPLIKLDG